MPYIPRVDRDILERDIAALAKMLGGLGVSEGRIGLMNYAITTLLLRCLPHGDYTSINAIVGVLECAKLEFARRVAFPYEDGKRGENSDVY